MYEKFATPLINRLEKHFVLTSSVLEDWQGEVLRKFEAWISQFCETRWSSCGCDVPLFYCLLCLSHAGAGNLHEEMLLLVTRRTHQQLLCFKLLTFSGD